jgi:hypothetical protein
MRMNRDLRRSRLRAVVVGSMREVAVDAQTDLFVAEADPPGDLEEPPVRDVVGPHEIRSINPSFSETRSNGHLEQCLTGPSPQLGHLRTLAGSCWIGTTCDAHYPSDRADTALPGGTLHRSRRCVNRAL